VSEHPDLAWRKTLKRRLSVASAVFFLWSVAIEARLVYLQVIRHEELRLEADRQQSDLVDILPKRGEILDRNGQPLAYDVDAQSVFANPREISDRVGTVERLCAALRDCDRLDRDSFARQLNRRREDGSQPAFVWLKRRMTPEQARDVGALKLKGVYLQTETRRYYPNKELAAHLLGWVGDGKGRAGIEEKYDGLIGGQAGQTVLQVDGNGDEFSRLDKSATPGGSVMLNIDPYIQYIAERELRDGVTWSGAVGGTVVVLESQTGRVLAMASNPTFNPNNLKASERTDRINRAVQNAYEPGSTFKVVLAGAALEEKLLRPTALIDTAPGRLRIGSRVIDEAQGHNYGTLTFEDVIVKSSNVGAVQIGMKLGAERFSAWVARFGFGAKASRSDFNGESRGLVVPPSGLNRDVLASLSMGYNISVTPLQMAAAVNVVATGGELIEPRLVKAEINGGVYTETPRNVVRRVFSTGTAAELTRMMEQVVERGTAKAAQIEGYTVAGKTGTAAKVLEDRRGYSATDYNVSFVGFVPSRDPQFTILVVVDSPSKVSAYGGTVAAPVFRKIAAAALRHAGVPRTLNPPAPLLIARRDKPQQPVSAAAEAPVVTVADATAESPTVFPDLAGMSARDAVRTLARLGVTLKMRGTGNVITQRPAPGTPIDLAHEATLWLNRLPPPVPVSDDTQTRALGTAGVVRGKP
jgi:cell division protein FtsI (penicillin-binding protein 3)